MNTPPFFLGLATAFAVVPANAPNLTLATNAAGTAFEARDVSNASLLTSGLLPSARLASFSGDLSGSYPSATVAKIKGATVGSSTVISGNIFAADGAQWNSVSISGDATLASTGALTLANTAVTPTTYGDGTHVGQFTVDAKGRITSATSVTITGAAPTGSAGGDLSATFPNPTVAKINGNLLGATTLTAGNLLIPDGSSWNSVALSGNATLSSSGVLTIGASQIINSMLAGSIAASKLIGSDIATVGTITSGVWNGTAISTSYITGLGTMAAQNASAVAISGGTITGLANPVNPSDAANKAYVDLTAQGFSAKPSAQLATTAALPTNVYNNGSSGVGATLTGVSSGALTIDGTAVSVGTNVLVKNEVTGANDGLYSVTIAGSVSTVYVLTRSTSMNTSSEFGGGYIVVESGSVNAGAIYLCTTNSPTVGTTAIAFTQINKANTYSADGTTLSLTGSVFSIYSGYVGQSSLTTLGTITTGVWNGTPIAIANGGTGQTSATAAFNALAPSQTGNSGYYLTTNGTNTSWAAISGGGVTSVALSLPSSILTVSGSPVTTMGTLTGTLATQSANYVWAGPTTGSAATPTFRALVAADVPASILPGSFSGLANPSASIGLTAVNGSATTAMRSDGAPALSQAILPTWTGQHIWSIATSLASATGAALDDLKVAAATTTITGTTTPITKLAKVGFYQPTITAANAITVTTLANVYIDGPPIAAGSLTITNPYSLLVNSGVSSFGGQIFGTINGALSAPGATFNGTWITGGTATTTKPYVLIEPSGTTSTGWSTSGTGLGINGPSGFNGSLITAQIAGAGTIFGVSSTGVVTGGEFVSGSTIYGSGIISVGFSNASSLNLQNNAGSTPGNIVAINNATYTGSSGTMTSLAITPTLNETSTAGSIEFLINRKETAIGSGSQLFLACQAGVLGGNTLASIDNKGSWLGYGNAPSFTGIAIPTGLAITHSGTAGTTTYAYRVAAVHNDGTITNACTEATTTTGNATLSGTNFTTLTWNAVAGAVAYRWYGRTSGSELLMGTVNGNGAATYTVNDTGAVTPSGALPGNPAGLTLTVSGWANQTAAPFSVLASPGGSTFCAVGQDPYRALLNLGFIPSGSTFVTLTDGSTVATNCALGSKFYWSLGGSHTLSSPTNMVDGQVYTWVITYSGSYTPTMPSTFDWGTTGAPTFTATSGKYDVITGIYSSAASKFFMSLVGLGF